MRHYNKCSTRPVRERRRTHDVLLSKECWEYLDVLGLVLPIRQDRADAFGGLIYGERFIQATIKFPTDNPLAEVPPNIKAHLTEGYDYWVRFLWWGEKHEELEAVSAFSSLPQFAQRPPLFLS